MVIGLVGYTGAGKSTVARLLNERHGAKVFRHSDLLKEVATTLGLPYDAVGLGEIWSCLSPKFGEAMVANRVCKLIDQACPDTGRLAVVDGVRIHAEVERYGLLPDFTLVKVVADQQTRFDRVRNRGGRPGECDMSWEEFLRIESSAGHRHVPGLLLLKGPRIETDSSEEQLADKIDALLRSLRP